MILSDVCEFIVDCPHSTAPDEGEGYPLIRTPNVGKGRLDLNGVHRVSESVYKQRIQRGAPRANDLILHEKPQQEMLHSYRKIRLCVWDKELF